MPLEPRQPSVSRTLAQTARHLAVPADFVRSDFPLIQPTLAEMAVGFDPWQSGIWVIALMRREDGSLACDEDGVTMCLPRQVGKTYTIGFGIFALCILFPGLLVIWTSHHDRTSMETLGAMTAMTRKPRIAPHVLKVITSDDQRGVHFKNGSRILFGARGGGAEFGRGIPGVDIFVYDEGQNLRHDFMADTAATMNTSSIGLAFVIGTPPKPKNYSEVFTEARNRGLKPGADPLRGAYIEVGADPSYLDVISDPNHPRFWEATEQANPSYPTRTSKSAIRRLRRRLVRDDDFRREGWGIWDTVLHLGALLDRPDWDRLTDGGPSNATRPDGLAVDASHRGEFSVVAAWVTDDTAHVEEVRATRDQAALVKWIVKGAGKKTPVAIDSYSPAAALIPTLVQQGVNVIKTADKGQQMIAACGVFEAMSQSRRLTHRGQLALTEAFMNGRKRAIGSLGGWGWTPADDSIPIRPLVAATLAIYAAQSTEKKRSGKVW